MPINRVPDNDRKSSIGSTLKRWLKAWLWDLQVDGGSLSNVAVILAKDYTDRAANNATVDGITLSVPITQLVAGKALEIEVTGISVGANAAKQVLLYIDDAAIGTLTFASTMVGNFYAKFLMVMAATNAQRVSGVGIAGTNAGATPS